VNEYIAFFLLPYLLCFFHMLASLHTYKPSRQGVLHHDLYLVPKRHVGQTEPFGTLYRLHYEENLKQCQ